jgi:hypothetical protein
MFLLPNGTPAFILFQVEMLDLDEPALTQKSGIQITPSEKNECALIVT